MLKNLLQNRKCMIYAGITLLIMVSIFIFSSQNGDTSGALSGRVEKLLKYILGETVFQQWLTGVWFNVRKFAHVFIYAMLGIFAYLTVNEAAQQVPVFEKEISRVGFVLLFCFLYACSDEFHQTFVPGRAGMFRDVMIDSIGSVSSILITNAAVRIR